jgi:NAD+ diphosphatase
MIFTPAVRLPETLSPHPLFFVCHERGLAVRRDRSRGLLPDEAEVRTLGRDATQALYQGRLGDQDCLAFALEEEPKNDEAAAGPRGAPAAGAALEVEGLRKLWGALDEDLFFAAGRAMQIALWAQTHRFCGRCGAETRRDERERCARCPRCGLGSYPRISPAIIVLVRRGEEALLARSPRLPAGTYSTLAGFVDVGESLEETLAREVREEVGIEVKNPRYFGSQPWPFPHSLMLGFMAEYAGGVIAVDGDEILDARWFRADALPQVPPPLSIARKLIDAWISEATGRAAAR